MTGLCPRLETERLVLRAPQPSDFKPLYDMVNDPSFLQHGFSPQSEEDVWNRLLRRVGHWAVVNYGAWMVEDRQTGLWLGEIGYFYPKRDGVDLAADVPEVGWALIEQARGKGLAREGIGRVLDEGPSLIGHVRSQCIINPGNKPSQRLAEYFRFRKAATATYHGHPVDVWQRGFETKAA